MTIGIFFIMKAKTVFAANMVKVLGKSKVKELIRHAGAAGISIDYTYVMEVRKGDRNPSLEKSEQIVEVLRLLPGYDWIEHWMFFIPNYFECYQGNVLQQGRITPTQFDDMIAELLVTACRLKFLEVDEQQFEQMKELASYIYQKRIESRTKVERPESNVVNLK